MKDFDIAVVFIDNYDLRYPAFNFEQLLQGIARCVDVKLFQGGHFGAVNADDSKTALAYIVVRILAHYDDTLTQPGFESLREPGPDNDSRILVGFEESACTYLCRDSAEVGLGIGFDAK